MEWHRMRSSWVSWRNGERRAVLYKALRGRHVAANFQGGAFNHGGRCCRTLQQVRERWEPFFLGMHVGPTASRG